MLVSKKKLNSLSEFTAVDKLESDDFWGRVGGLVDRAADSGPYDPSSIPFGENKENKRERGLGWTIFRKKLESEV